MLIMSFNKNYPIFTQLTLFFHIAVVFDYSLLSTVDRSQKLEENDRNGNRTRQREYKETSAIRSNYDNRKSTNSSNSNLNGT